MQNVNAVLESLQQTPLGQAPGDPRPGLALNYSESSELIKCYVRNWSGNIKRKFIVDHISPYRGGERTAELMREKAQPFDVEKLRAQAARGTDASIKDYAIKPVAVKLQFNQMLFLVDPSKDPKKDPEWVPIPQGVMDLYYGNWERLEGLDARERAREIERVQFRRQDVCIRKNKAGVNENEYGFLEFKREIMQPMQVAVDAEMVFTDDYVEV